MAKHRKERGRHRFTHADLDDRVDAEYVRALQLLESENYNVTEFREDFITYLKRPWYARLFNLFT